MANYRVEYHTVDRFTGLPEDRPREIHWFQRRGLSRKDLTNMLLACTQDGEDIIGFIYRNEEYIGMVEVEVNDLYKRTALIIHSHQPWFKHQWKRRAV